MHTRRRRITAESSVGRESFTCVSRLLQLGQRIRRRPLFFAHDLVGKPVSTFPDHARY
jgi:hypothetical protein